MEHYLALVSFGEGGWGGQFVEGASITIGLALATLPLGLVIGLVVALAQGSSHMLLRKGATVYVTIFRGLPELLTLYLIYFGLQFGIQRLWTDLHLPGHFEMHPFMAGMIALGVVMSAYSSEVWVAALGAVPKGQKEAARSLGLTASQCFRLVTLPQLFRVALPGLGNNWMVLLKETSLVSTITLPDIMFKATRGNVVTKEPFLFFGVAALIYLFFSLVSMAGLSWLEARAARGYLERA